MRSPAEEAALHLGAELSGQTGLRILQPAWTHSYALEEMEESS